MFPSSSLSSLSILFAVLLLHSAVDAAATIRSPSRHSHFAKRTWSRNSGLGPCLTASSNSNGAPVTISSCNTEAAFQWSFPSSGSGAIKLYDNKCLDVTNGANKNGQKMQIWTCTGGPNQQFVLTNGQIQWKGSDKCLDMTDGNKSSGTRVQLWQCYSGNSNQQWSYPSTSSTPSSAISSISSGSLFKTKLGLAYPDNDFNELRGISAAKMFYNWSPSPGALGSSSSLGVTFIPQLWGWNQQSQFDSMAKTSNASLFFGMNECNEPGQSNMSPESGISLWRQSMKPLRDRGKKVCSPAMSGNPNGITWMKTFSSKCPDCTFDYTCVHWYDTTFEKFKSWVEQWHSLYPSAPILITEFAPQNFNAGPQPTVDQVWQFYQQAIPWAMSQDYVHGVFPYGFMRDLNINGNAKLLNSDGTPTNLGKWILSQA